MDNCEIYVYLLDEGVDAWRPVKAIKIGLNRYKIIGINNYNPDDEKWQFLPDDVVECEEKKFADGKSGLVAVRKVDE